MWWIKLFRCLSATPLCRPEATGCANFYSIEYFKFPSLQEIQAVGLTFVLTIVTYADKPTIKQTKNSSKMTGMEASSVKCALKYLRRIKQDRCFRHVMKSMWAVKSRAEKTIFDKSMKTFGELVVLGVLILRFECKINYLYILRINSLCVMDVLV